MMEPDVEPDRRVERAVLIHAKPGQLVVKSLGCFRVREIAVGDSPVGDRSRDAMHQLPHGRFPAALVRIRAVRDVAVEIFRDRDLGRERAPALRHLDVLLLEDHLAAVVGDFRRAPLPIDLVERRHIRVAEHALETAALASFFFVAAIFHPKRRFTGAIERGRREAGFELDHGGGGGQRLGIDGE